MLSLSHSQLGSVCNGCNDIDYYEDGDKSHIPPPLGPHQCSIVCCCSPSASSPTHGLRSELHHVAVSRPRTPCRHRVKISIITRLSLVPHHRHRSNTRMKIVFSIEEVNFCPSLAAGEMCEGDRGYCDCFLALGCGGQSPDTGSWGHLLPQHLSTGFYLHKIYDS